MLLTHSLTRELLERLVPQDSGVNTIGRIPLSGLGKAALLGAGTFKAAELAFGPVDEAIGGKTALSLCIGTALAGYTAGYTANISEQQAGFLKGMAACSLGSMAAMQAGLCAFGNVEDVEPEVLLAATAALSMLAYAAGHHQPQPNS